MGLMTSPDVSARPSQVTIAGWAVAVASVFLLLAAFDALGSLHTIDTREALSKRITSGNLQGLGLTVADALELKRWALYVSAVASVATAILGVYVLRRDKAARIGLSVAAVPIVLAAPFTQSFLGMVIGAGAVVLWSRTARDWFAGRPITPREPRPQPRPEQRTSRPDPTWSPPTTPTTPSAPHGTAGNQPPPTLGWGAAPGATTSLADLPPPTSTTPLWLPPPTAPDPLDDQPREVRFSCILTWVSTAVTAVGALLLLIAIGVDRAEVLDAIRGNQDMDSSISDDTLVQGLMVGSVVVLLWCTGAALVAVFTWRGLHWAWVLHVVSTVLAALLAVWLFPNTLLHLAAIGTVLGLLTSRPTREWFSRHR